MDLIKERSVILIVNEYFFPAYRAGGPIQSLTNLIIALEHEIDFSVFASAYDLSMTEPMSAIKINSWNEVNLVGAQKELNVFYATRNFPKGEIKNIINAVNPTFVYLNGIFSFQFFIWILMLRKSFNFGVIICPRGMLQKGALAGKSFKKSIYLKILKLSGLLNKANWHATNLEEKEDIKKYFPKNKGIFIAKNIPKIPYQNISIPKKIQGELRLVYLSLITEKKNLLFTLELLIDLDRNISLDIYGPVKDNAYWKSCIQLINQMPDRVKYRGDLFPDMVQETLSKYHAFILLTKGENFGHAIYESLSVGRPIITSFYTPWMGLKEGKSGINVDIGNSEESKCGIVMFMQMDQVEYEVYCKAAHTLAVSYYSIIKPTDSYDFLRTIN